MYDLYEADFEWTIHHFASQLIPDYLNSTIFEMGKTKADTLKWRLSIDKDGIKIAHQVRVNLGVNIGGYMAFSAGTSDRRFIVTSLLHL